MMTLPPPAPATIVVAVDNVKSDAGTVHVDICTQDHFLKDCRWGGDAPAKAGRTLVTVRDVPPGRYAAQAFQDEKRIGRVPRNFLGIPTVGVGFSNDAPIHLAPPKFADAAFDHGDAQQTISFRLRYFL